MTLSASSPNTQPHSDWQEDEPVRRYSADEIRVIQARQPRLSIWRIVAWQWIASLVVCAFTLLAVWIHPAISAGSLTSVAWGALCAALPSTLMAWGLRSRSNEGGADHTANSGLAGLHLIRFAVWELTKIIISVVLLAISPWIIPKVQWLWLVLSYVVVLKVFWLAAVLQLKRH